MKALPLPAYPNKVLLAWAEAITGHEELRDWLMGSDYPELGVFCHALNNEPTSRAWLRHRGHAHLMALIEGAEDNDEDALARLMRGDPDINGIWALIALRIQHVKNGIEEANNDVHRIDPN
jgi:hypothetical protein